MPLTPRQIEAAVADISIAAVRSWLKGRGLPHSANTREQLLERLSTLFTRGKLSETEFEDALTSIEEASAKRVTLYNLSSGGGVSSGKDEGFSRRLKRLGIRISEKAKLAPRHPPEPILVYVTHDPIHIRAKWAETQVRVDFDLVKTTFTKTKTTKTVLLVADVETGLAQMRYDKPENIHSHQDTSKQPDDALYHAYYFNKGTEILGVSLIPLDLRGALRVIGGDRTENRQGRIERLPHRFKFKGALYF